MEHNLNTRMNYVRAALCDPRLTNRQQKTLAAIATFMPFEVEEGWVLKTSEIARSVYFGKHPTSTVMRETRRILGQLEDAGLLTRIYPGSVNNPSLEPTIFVNWERLQDPYREAARPRPDSGHLAPSTRGTLPRVSLVSPLESHPGAGIHEQEAAV